MQVLPKHPSPGCSQHGLIILPCFLHQRLHGSLPAASLTERLVTNSVTHVQYKRGLNKDTRHPAPPRLYLKQHRPEWHPTIQPQTPQTAGKLGFGKTIWRSGWPHRRRYLSPRKAKGSVNGHMRQDHRHLMNGTVSAGRGGGPEDRAEGNETVSGDLKRNSRKHRSVQKKPMAHTQWPKLYLAVSIFTKGTKGVP